MPEVRQTSVDRERFYEVHDVASDFGHARSYEWLRDVAIWCFNPPDHDGAEEDIVADAIFDAADFIAAQPCECTPAMVEDRQACRRCDLLGRLGDEAVSR